MNIYKIVYTYKGRIVCDIQKLDESKLSVEYVINTLRSRRQIDTKDKVILVDIVRL